MRSGSRPHAPPPAATVTKSIPTLKQPWLGIFNEHQKTFQKIFVQKESRIPEPSSSLLPTPPADWCPWVPGSRPFGADTQEALLHWGPGPNSIP